MVRGKVTWTTTGTPTTHQRPDPCRHGEARCNRASPDPRAGTPEAVTHAHRHQTAGRGRGDAVRGWPWPGATQTRSAAQAPRAPLPRAPGRSPPCPTRGADQEQVALERSHCRDNRKALEGSSTARGTGPGEGPSCRPLQWGPKLADTPDRRSPSSTRHVCHCPHCVTPGPRPSSEELNKER